MLHNKNGLVFLGIICLIVGITLILTNSWTRGFLALIVAALAFYQSRRTGKQRQQASSTSPTTSSATTEPPVTAAAEQLAAQWLAAARQRNQEAAKPQSTVSKEEFTSLMLEAIRRVQARENGTSPEPPAVMPQDCDDGSCPYPRDRSKPLGSKENPIVVGIPECSDRLVHDEQHDWWLLTDGQGNGWSR